MAQINISNTGTSGIETPQTGVVAIFSNSADSGRLYYKFADGSTAPVDTGGGGTAGTAGTSGTSGLAGSPGTSGTSGEPGTSGTSGEPGTSGTSGEPGTSGTSGEPGTSGTSGVGVPTGGTIGQVLAKINGTDYNTEWVDQTGGGGNTSGTSGSSGTSGTTGTSGTSGTSGEQGDPGTSGTSGEQGDPGTSGTSGTSGEQGDPGTSGTSGEQGLPGTSGTSGEQGDPGTSGTSGEQGLPGTSGTSGTSGEQGLPGTSGTSGEQGLPGTSGTSGTSGEQGLPGTSGTSGEQGLPGTSGTSGEQGLPGTSGTSGEQGLPGTSGTSGEAGTSGTSGEAGTSGTSGESGTSGTSGVGSAVEVTDGITTVTATDKITFSGATVTDQGNNDALVTISGGGGGGGISDIYNNNIRYTAYTQGTADTDGRIKIDITSTADLTGGLTWARSGTTLTITSTAHGLSTNDYIVIRNMSEDSTYVQVTATDANTLTATVANSGDTSGTEGAYIPAYAVSSVTEDAANPGEISNATFDNPNNGNPILHSIVTYVQSGDGQGENVINVTFTVPTGTAGGAGGYTSKETINPPIISVVGLDGTGTSSSVPAGVSLNLINNRNVITITGTDDLNVGQVYKLFFG